MKIATYIDRLWSGLKQQPGQFDRHSTQTKNTLRAATACTLAIFLALFLQAPNPFWSAISAFIVTQSSVGSTVIKSSLRLSGTVIGAVIAVIFAGLFIHQHLLYTALIYASAFIGIYMSLVDRKHMYAWLLGYVTLLMVMIPSMQNGTSQHIIFLAFYRSFEIIIGIIAGLIATYTIFPNHAKHHLYECAQPLSTALIDLTNLHINALGQPVKAIAPDVFENQIKQITPLLDQLESHIDQSQYEFGSGKHAQSFHQYATAIHQAFYVLIEAHRHYAVDAEVARCWQYFCPLLTELHQQLNQIIKTSHRLIQKQATPLELSQDLQVFRQKWIALKHYYQDHRTDLKQKFSIHTVDSFIQLAMTFRLMAYQFEPLANPTAKSSTSPKLSKPKTPWYKRLFAYHTFYLKHAAIGAAAILIVPFIWLILAFPGFQQIAISIAASIGMSGQGTQYKGFLRLSGCFAGAILAMLCLGLDIESTLIFLILVFLVSAFFLYFHYGPETISYFGTQAAVVFFIGFINTLHPTTSTIPGLERLEGIFLGVCSIIVFQWLFWSFNASRQLRHHLKQIKVALYYPTYLIQQAFIQMQSTHIPDWCSSQLAEMRLSIQATQPLQTVEDPAISELSQTIYQHYRNIHQHLYNYLMIQENAVDLATSLSLMPTLKNHILKLLQVLNRQHHQQQAITTSQIELRSIQKALTELRQAIRENADDTLSNQPIYALFDLVTLTNTTRALCQDTQGLLIAISALLRLSISQK